MLNWEIRTKDLTILEISIANEVFRESQIIFISLTFSINTSLRKYCVAIFNHLIMDKCYFKAVAMMLMPFFEKRHQLVAHCSLLSVLIPQ